MKKFRHIPYLNTSISEDLCLTILLIPLWWYLGVKFFIFHLVALFAFIKLLISKRKNPERIHIPKETYLLAIFIMIYCLSLVINFKNIPFLRLLASLNNLSFWVMGFLIILVVHNSVKRENIHVFLRTFLYYGIMCSVFVLSTLTIAVISHKYILRTESLLYKLLPHDIQEIIITKAPLLKINLILTIVGKSRLFTIRNIQRPKGFNLWATSLGGTMLILIVMTLAYYKTQKKKSGLWLILPLEILTLLLSLSRNAFWLLLAWMIVYAITHLKKSLLPKILPVALIGIVVFFLLIPPQNAIKTIIGVRHKSTLTRFRLYSTAFSQSLNKPLLGYGYKSRSEEYKDPIGSHSMYFGALYKTGFLGLLAFLFFWMSIVKRWWIQKKSLKNDKVLKHVWFYAGIALFGGLLWMLGEDLDVQPILSFIYFIIISLILCLDKLKYPQDEE